MFLSIDIMIVELLYQVILNFNMKIKHITEIYVEDYQFATDMEENLIPLLENYPDKQNRETNVKATMTEWQITHPQIEKLKKYIIYKVKTVFRKFDFNCSVQFECYIPDLKDFWANIYNQGDFTRIHNHIPSHYSFTYFLQSRWYHSPLVFAESGKRIRPKYGRLVIFPSYLNHYVPRHRFKEKRITLSGNMLYKDNSTVEPIIAL